MILTVYIIFSKRIFLDEVLPSSNELLYLKTQKVSIIENKVFFETNPFLLNA
jgi:hypothetical protein